MDFFGETERVRQAKAPKIVRGENPSPRHNERIEQAKTLFGDFTGHEGEVVDIIKLREYDTAVCIGTLDFVGYTTVRDGVVEAYKHTFRKKSRPHLAVSQDGKQLFILGGGYEFTESGINDR